MDTTCEWCGDEFPEANGIESDAEDQERFCSASCEEMAEGNVF